MDKIKAGIVGASGYTGGELLRLLLFHPHVEVTSASSSRYEGEFIHHIHSNLRGLTKLKFTSPDMDRMTQNAQFVFTATPHGKAMNIVKQLLDRGVKVIDLSADHRLKDPNAYHEWYGWTHKHPDTLKEAVYGLPELHRSEIKDSRLVAVPGCMSTAAILPLAPIVANAEIEMDRVVIDAKVGSSAAGSNPNLASHHPERAGGVRPYRTVRHRHIAEIEQELDRLGKGAVRVSFTPHAVSMVRGILATAHVFTKTPLTNQDLWKIYRNCYDGEPFIRVVKDRKGVYQLPNPKIVQGTNYCDIGFDIDDHAGRVILYSAIDNLVKGAAGQAVQCFNIMNGLSEDLGLAFPGFHPM